ncbi:MAG TPA: alanine racemase [Bacilli bacterium]|nr:alanine racemase [Bacilli bacterium]
MSELSEQLYVRPTWAEINLDRIAHNVQAVRRSLPPDAQVMAVVKANGYGHGAIPVARMALKAGATYLAVSSVDEALELRKANITAPVLVLGYTPPSQAQLVVEEGLTQTLYQQDMLEALHQAALAADRPAKVHIKVDTGMGRLGFTGVDEAVDFAKRTAATPGVELEGLFTHFATADEENSAYAEKQAARWQALLQAMQAAGIEIPLVHISNSAAILQYGNCAGNMVRLGISMYGYYPSDEVSTQVELRPSLRLLSQVVHVKQVEAGTKISYGATFETKRPSQIATVPVGYADGYSRALSNRADVLVGGRRVPVIGRICMDQLMLDVTEVPGVAVGDEVVLYGAQGDERIALEEVADLIGTISYEVCCALGRRVPRLYLEQGQLVDVVTM